MKYVRTKDGIYKTDSPIQPEKELQIKWIDDHCFETSWKTKPCEWKQADTIEELCDEFVCKSKTSDFWQVSPHLNWKEYDLEHFNFYGAIWTDKGLIYVAKMNDKGELELL